MSDFRVSKQRVRVQMLLFDKVREGTLFLTTVSSHHEGAETVLDVLLDSDAFLAAEMEGQPHCIPKEALAAVWAPLSAAVSLSSVEPQPVPVRVHLAAKSAANVLDGELRYSLPNDECRPLDYLNQQAAFFPLFPRASSGRRKTQRKGITDMVVLVQRRHVASVAITSGRVTKKPSSRRRKR